MNRPVLIIVIGYIIGIIWGLYLKISIVLFYTIFIAIYIIVNVQYKKKKFKILSIKRYFRYLKIYLKINVIFIIIISSFFSNLIIKKENQKYENLYKEIRDITISGVIVSNKIEKEYYNRFKIKVLDEKFKDTYLYINVAKNMELEYGDRIEINGEFIEPKTARNYKGFNYKQYLKTLKIYGIVKVKDIQIKEKAHKWMPDKIINNISLKVKDNIKQAYNEETQGIILGVILGYTNDIDEEVKEQFSKSNISHVLAVSGMHVSYLVFLITNITQRPFGKRKSKIIACVILIFYMYITGLSISVVRACIMGIISCMSFVVYRKNNTLNNIAISALIILVNNPFSLFNLSFLLTYGGTIGIILFNSDVEKMLKSIKIKNRKWKYLFLKIQRKCELIIKILSVSISSQLIIAPIIILKFNSLGIAFLITNLLLNTVIGFIVIGGLVQIVISFISQRCSIAIAKIIELPTYILMSISKLGDKIPLGYQKVITPDLYQIIIYYIVIFVFMYLYKLFHIRNPNQTQIRIRNMIYLLKYKTRSYKKEIVIMTVITVIATNIIITPKDLRIYFIDVGQGDATLIVTPNNKRVLIDGGGSKSYNTGKNVLIPYLLARKIDSLDLILISHFDQDHVRSEY